MGRQLRRVPPNWDHPKQSCQHIYDKCERNECYIPLYDETYENAAETWLKDFKEYKAEEHDNIYFWDWHGMPPEIDSYRTYKDEDATWYQVYETISEGTPVTPPFEKKEELIEYLVNYGDFWNQSRNERGYSKENAEKFVNESGYAPSLVVSNGVIFVGIDSCEVL